MVSIKAFAALTALASSVSAQYFNSSSDVASSLDESDSFIYSPTSSGSIISSSSALQSSTPTTNGIVGISAIDTYTGSSTSDSRYHWFTIQVNVEKTGGSSPNLTFILPDSFRGFPEGDIDVLQNGQTVGTLKHTGNDFVFDFDQDAVVDTSVTFTALLTDSAIASIDSPRIQNFEFESSSGAFASQIEFVPRDLTTVGKNAGNDGERVWWTIDIPAQLYHGSFDFNAEAPAGYGFSPELLKVEIVTGLDAFNNKSFASDASTADYVVNADSTSITLSYTGASIDGAFLRITYFAAPGDLVFWPNEALIGLSPAAELVKRDTVYSLEDNYNIVAVANIGDSAGSSDVDSASAVSSIASSAVSSAESSASVGASSSAVPSSAEPSSSAEASDASDVSGSSTDSAAASSDNSESSAASISGSSSDSPSSSATLTTTSTVTSTSDGQVVTFETTQTFVGTSLIVSVSSGEFTTITTLVPIGGSSSVATVTDSNGDVETLTTIVDPSTTGAAGAAGSDDSASTSNAQVITSTNSDGQATTFTTTHSNGEVATLTTTGSDGKPTTLTTTYGSGDPAHTYVTFGTTDSNGQSTTVTGEIIETTTITNGHLVTLTTTYCPLTDTSIPTVTAAPVHGGSAVTFTTTGADGKSSVFVGEEYTTTVTHTNGNIVTLTSTYCPLTSETDETSIPTVTVAPVHGGSAVTFTTTGADGKSSVFVGEEFTTTVTHTNGNVVTLTSTYCPLTAGAQTTIAASGVDSTAIPTVTFAPVHGGSAVTFTTTGADGKSTAVVGEEYTITTKSNNNIVTLTTTYCPLSDVKETSAAAPTNGIPITFTTTGSNGETTVITGQIVESTSTGSNGEITTISSVYVPPAVGTTIVESTGTISPARSTGYVVVDSTTNNEGQSVYYTSTASTPVAQGSASETAVIVQSSNAVVETVTTVIPPAQATVASEETEETQNGSTNEASQSEVDSTDSTQTVGQVVTQTQESNDETSTSATTQTQSNASGSSSGSSQGSSSVAAVSTYAASGMSLKSSSFLMVLTSALFYLL